MMKPPWLQKCHQTDISKLNVLLEDPQAPIFIFHMSYLPQQLAGANSERGKEKPLSWSACQSEWLRIQSNLLDSHHFYRSNSKSRRITAPLNALTFEMTCFCSQYTNSWTKVFTDLKCPTFCQYKQQCTVKLAKVATKILCDCGEHSD